jgi:hypothetical protein
MAATRWRVRTAGAALAAGALLTAGCAGAADPGPLGPAAATPETPAPTPSPTESTPSEPAPTPSLTEPTPSEPAPTPSPSESAPAPEPGGDAGDLQGRLLPASAFGADATVVGLTPEQLGAAGAGWGGWGGGWWGPRDDHRNDHRDDHDQDHGQDHGDDDGVGDGTGDRAGAVDVQPEACGALLDSLPSLDGAGDPPALAAQAARTPQTQTIQVLAESPAIAELRLPVDQLLADCATVTVTGPWDWSTTVEVTRVDVPPLGQQSAGVQVSVDRAGDETHSVLVGLVLDGSRGLVLAQRAAPDAAAPDPAAFGALLAEAAQAAAG